MLDTFFFYAFALMTLGGAVLTITTRNAVHSAVSLIISLLGVAGLFLLQKAEFLFVTQIVLYVGGIMLLFLFVIMLVNLDEAAKQRRFNGQWVVVLLCVVGIAAEVGYFVRRGTGSSPWSSQPPVTPIRQTGNTEAVGDVLFGEYLLPFEIASVLLLAAVIGSVYMARKSDVEADQD